MNQQAQQNVQFMEAGVEGRPAKRTLVGLVYPGEAD